jgi:Uma2 family endonuclease
MSSSSSSHDDSKLPDLDDRLVTPGTRYEMLDRELIYVPPADGPHATRHSAVLALLQAHVAPGLTVACDLLTRTSKVDDFAPDASVYPSARDPATGGRQLMDLAFEVVSTETMSDAGKKAGKLTARGVRRVFAINVERDRALEWSTELGTWSVLDSGASITDPVLAVPLPVAALLRDARTDDLIARALDLKRNRVIEEIRSQERATGQQLGLAEGKQLGLAEGKQLGLAEGKQLGLIEAVCAFLRARGLPMTDAELARIRGERDPGVLARWVVRVATCVSVAQLFEDV